MTEALTRMSKRFSVFVRDAEKTIKRKGMQHLNNVPSVNEVRVRPENDAALTADETFWNFLFSFAFGHAGKYFSGRDPSWGILSFLAFYNVWGSMGKYSSRFNDKDMLHRLLWGTWGLSILCMTLFAERGKNRLHVFAFATASVKLCLWALFCRVAICSTAHRRMAQWHLVGIGVDILIWLLVGNLVRTDPTSPKMWGLFFLTALDLGEAVTAFPHYERVAQPMSHHYITSRMFNLQMMVLGVSMGGTIQHFQDVDTNPEFPWRGVSLVLGAGVFNLCVRALLQEVEAVIPEDHCRLRNHFWDHAWSKLHMAFVGASVVHSGGLHRLIAGHGGGEMTAFGAAVMYLVLFFLDQAHLTPSSSVRRAGYIFATCTALVVAIADFFSTETSPIIVVWALAFNSLVVVVSITMFATDDDEPARIHKVVQGLFPDVEVELRSGTDSLEVTGP